MFGHHESLGRALAPLAKRAMMSMHPSMMSGSSGHGHMSDDGAITITLGQDGEKPDQVQMPGWFWLAGLAIFVVFLPVFCYISYTLNSLLPTLAMIEDPAPPAYEPLSTADEAEAPLSSSSKPKPVTASIRQSMRMLRSISGIPSLFRGIWCLIFASTAMSVAQSFFAAFIPTVFLKHLLAPLPAVLVTLPLTTAWTHIVMSAPKSVRWYRRIPPMRKTFVALWRPALLMWVAIAVTTSVPQLIIYLSGATDELLSQDPNYSSLAGTFSIVGVVALVLSLLLIVPAHVIFTRVQASLLPLEDEPIIAFDRSFAGAIEPEIVGGRGYATLSDAWSTYSRENWIRLVKLYAKILGLTFITYGAVAAVFIPVFVVARKQATVIPGGS